MPLSAFLSRQALGPTLRMVRDRLAANPTVPEVRKWAARADRAYPKQPRGARSSEVAIGDANAPDAVRATWIDAKGARKDRVILYLHGGAFIAETPGIHSALVARIGAQARVRALMPSYRLAPEFPWPAALDDCIAAYRFLLDDGFCATDIALVGDSAGGNLVLGLMLRARDENLPLPAGAVVMSPATDGTLSGDSLRRNAGHDAMFAPSLFHALAPLYLPDPKLRTHPHVSPLHGNLQGLPPILMLVGSTELLLDDSVRFASKCPSATLEVWHDMPHVFPLFDFLPEAADATQRIGRFLRECFAAAQTRVDDVALRAANDDVRFEPVPEPAEPAEPAEHAEHAEHAARDARGGDGMAEPPARDPEPTVSPGTSVAISKPLTPRAWLYLGLALLAAIAAVAVMVR
jgi:epsilon-lactone hydrolase